MSRFVLVLVSILMIFRTPFAKSAKCVNTEQNYTSGSVFESNLKYLLTTLKIKSSSLKFYNNTVGEAPDKVYGLFQCRNDVGIDVCSTCVDGAYRGFMAECPFYGEAIEWYDNCMVRYASRNIFSLSENSPYLGEINVNSMSNYSTFLPILNRTLLELVKDATAAFPYFAMAKTEWMPNQTIDSYVQCSPDLSIDGCSSCLDDALADMMHCCSKYIGAKIFHPSCQVRFESGRFLNFTTPPPPPPSSLKPGIIVAIGVCVSIGLVLVVLLWMCRKKPKKHDDTGDLLINAEGLGDEDFVQYDFETLKASTDDFSTEKTLGKGGFGFVYKGTLENGETLAIKRLSSTSGQGTNEFMAEARFLAKLQHTNLAKLKGFCLVGEEKLLVYEFLSNSSLDRYLFDPVKRPLLDWVTRFNIISGIAKGLRYLHEDSRITIIHRDLKPDNILLDEEMNPKIADFGLAKLTEVIEKRGITSRIIGTQGYMAPECFMGEFSDKSDVYSFGVMLLEIVSGQNNMLFYQLTRIVDLPSHAWRLWNEGRSFELTDPELNNKCSREEVMRCIQIGLLCLQTDEEKRPKMSAVVYMLMGLGDIPLPSELEMSSRPLYMPIYDNDEQQTSTDHFSTQSVNLPVAVKLSRDLYPAPK